MQEILKVAFFLSMLLITLSTHATEVWQYAGGNYLAFVLPDRPLGEQKYYDKLIELSRNLRKDPEMVKFIKKTNARCPAFVRLIQ